MATLVTYGDRMLTTAGRASWLKRPSVPLAMFGRDGVSIGPDGVIASFIGLYDSQPWVAAAVNKINRHVMALPLRLYREVTDDGEFEPVHQHPIMDLILHPWERCGSVQLKQKLSFPTLVHGNAVLGKIRDEPNGPPTQLVPLDWRFLIPWSLDDGEILFWESTQPDRAQFWGANEVVHVAFEAGNGDLGVSPLKQLGTTLRIDSNAQTYQASSMEKGVRPSGALMTEQDLTPAQRGELRDEIRTTQAGADPLQSFFLLSGGMKWQPFSHTMVEAQLIEQRKLNREEVAAVYDMPPPLIGILDHATYSNIGEMYDRFYQTTLKPHLTLIADTLTAQLIKPEPAWADERLFFEFDLSDVLRADTPEEITALAAGIGAGLYSPNEGRNRLRQRKSTQKGADLLYMPSNNLTPMGQAPPEPAAPPAPALNPASPTDEDEAAKRHIERAKRLIERQVGGGKSWDRARWIRELHDDAPGIDGFDLASRFEVAILEAGGDLPEFRKMAAEITH
jgi:HK97 family phage portal protein